MSVGELLHLVLEGRMIPAPGAVHRRNVHCEVAALSRRCAEDRHERRLLTVDCRCVFERYLLTMKAAYDGA